MTNLIFMASTYLLLIKVLLIILSLEMKDAITLRHFSINFGELMLKHSWMVAHKSYKLNVIQNHNLTSKSLFASIQLPSKVIIADECSVTQYRSFYVHHSTLTYYYQ